jgi:hypothetical protein
MVSGGTRLPDLGRVGTLRGVIPSWEAKETSSATDPAPPVDQKFASLESYTPTDDEP